MTFKYPRKKHSRKKHSRKKHSRKKHSRKKHSRKKHSRNKSLRNIHYRGSRVNNKTHMKGGYLIQLDETTLSSRKNLKRNSDCVSCTLLSLGFPQEIITNILGERHDLKDDTGKVKTGITIDKMVAIINEYLKPISTIIKRRDNRITKNEEITKVLEYIYSDVLEPGTITFISYNYRRPDGLLGGHMMLVAKTITPTYYLIDARAPREQNPDSIYFQDNNNFGEDSPIFNFFKLEGGVLSSKDTVIDRITTYQSYCMILNDLADRAAADAVDAVVAAAAVGAGAEAEKAARVARWAAAEAAQAAARVIKIVHAHPEIKYIDEFEEEDLTLKKTLTSEAYVKSYFIWHDDRKIVLPMISPPMSIAAAAAAAISTTQIPSKKD